MLKTLKHPAKARPSSGIVALGKPALAREHSQPLVFAEDFITSVSHELRTPLSLIHGYVETLKGGVIKNGPSIFRCLEVMEKHSRRMMRILDDMLILSRLQSGDAQLRHETFHVRACVEDVLEHLTPLVELRQPCITLDFPPDGDLLNGDRFFWDQVFTRLIEHILQTHPQPDLRLSIRGEWRAAECVLTVSDNGVSIPISEIPFVFTPFQRHDQGHACETRGTGLGLCIARSAVEAHGGSIEACGAPDVEARFVIRVPVEPRFVNDVRHCHSPK